MLDIDEHCHHWKGRKEWKRNYAEKMFKRDCKVEGAVVITKDRVNRLGVNNPEEYNFDDIVQMEKVKKGEVENSSIKRLTSEWGSGCGGVSVLSALARSWL